MKRKQVDKTPWRNRIVGYGEEAPDQLLAHESNWRIHPGSQQDALSGVLHEVGLVQNIVVNRRSGKVIDGHLRVALAISEGQPLVPITYVDLDDAEEALILASLDPLGDLAISDSDKLNGLLGEIDVSNEALDLMLYSLLSDSTAATLKDETEREPEPGDSSRSLGDKAAQIKPVLYADEVAIFEQAIRFTGERNRGKALIEICRAYIQQTEGQFDFQPKSAVA